MLLLLYHLGISIVMVPLPSTDITDTGVKLMVRAFKGLVSPKIREFEDNSTFS